jgi:hypothetical protein
MTQSEEIERLRAQLAAARMQIAALQSIRLADAEWIGRSQNQITTLITAVKDLQAGRAIDPEAVELLENSRPTSKWL